MDFAPRHNISFSVVFTEELECFILAPEALESMCGVCMDSQATEIPEYSGSVSSPTGVHALCWNR